MNERENISTRRFFLGRNGLALAAASVLGPAALLAEQRKTAKSQQKTKDEVSPPEDLMREHGLLNRLLLIYEETERRLRQNADPNPQVLGSAAAIIRDFIENYHEKLEEDHLFPRFERAGKLTELVGVLRRQHQAGRRITAEILDRQALSAIKTSGDRNRLADNLRAFVRMYRPHEAREDTVLFPALRSIVSPHEFDALGEQFEDKEHELFGDEGFEKMVDKVAGLEKTLGIYDLAMFTPK